MGRRQGQDGWQTTMGKKLFLNADRYHLPSKFPLQAEWSIPCFISETAYLSDVGLKCFLGLLVLESCYPGVEILGASGIDLRGRKTTHLAMIPLA